MRIKTMFKAFTLIELLVVITIIGILATGAVSIYTSQIQKARDSTRLTSIKAIQGGVEQFYQDESVFPIGLDDWTDTASTSVMTYLPNLSKDPKHDQTCNGSRCGYIYFVGPDDNGIIQGSYELSTAFESQGNLDNRAAGDTGTDDNRLEIGLDNDTNLTPADKDTPFTNTVATNSSTTLVIEESAVTEF